MEKIKLPEKSRFTIISFDAPSKNGRRQVLVQCECGTVDYKILSYIKNGNTLSCGCLARETLRKNGSKKKHNGRGTRLYNIWKNMRQRCTNPNASGYKNYGAKGIKVDEIWDDYNTFAEWAKENGYNDELEIDRIDSSKNYTPTNCQWVTKSVNSAKRNTDKKNRGFTRSRFSDKQIEEIKNKREQGCTYKKLSQEYNTSISHVKRIIDGEIKYTNNKEEVK